MDAVFNFLEKMAKYGIIDILFGIGIISLLGKLLRRKKTFDIEGIDLIPGIDRTQSMFTLMIKNQSREALYLYKAYLKPGYYSSDLDKSSIRKMIQTLILKTWITEKFPKTSGQPKTTKGLYILQLQNNRQGYSPTLFIEPYRNDRYILRLDPNSLVNYTDLEDLFEANQFGTLIGSFVHGTRSGQLEVLI